MKPLADLSDAVCASLVGVVFDVDDTLTRGGIVEREAYDALWALRRTGLRLAAVTGRPLGWTDVIAHLWPVDVAVGENGAGWTYRDGNVLVDGYFHDEPTRQAHAATLSAVRADVADRMPQVRLAADQRARRCDLAFDVGELVTLSRDEIAQLVGIIESHGARSAVSTVHAHAIAGDWDKAAGARRAVGAATGDDLAADRDRWLFVGDSGNDSPAFSWFTLTVGVANVHDHLAALPDPPRFVTEADRGRGFAELAAHLIERRGAP